MSIRLKKEDFLKKEKLEVPETLKEELVNDEYDLDSFGDAFIMMPKMEEDKRQQNLEKNIKKALVTCSTENPASRAVIVANGGVFEDVRNGVERYWIDLE